MINTFLILSILAWPFGLLLNLTPFGSAIRFQLLDLLSVFLFLALIPSFHQIKKDILFKPIALFCLAALLSLIVNPETVSLASLAYYLRFVSYTSFYFAFRLLGVKKYHRLLTLSTSTFLLIGLAQYLFLPDIRFLRYLGFDDHYYRLVGSFLDPNFTGPVLAILTLLTPWPYLLAPLLALLLTFSRASYLAFGLGLVFLVISQKRLKLLSILFLLAVGLYLVPKPFGEGVNLLRTFSITSRLQNQQAALSLFVQKPIFGYGFNTFKQTKVDLIPNLTSGVDNSFLFVLVTTGVVGFVAFLNFLKTALSLATTPIIKAALIVVLVHSFFNNSFFYSPILALFFLLLNLKPKAST